MTTDTEDWKESLDRYLKTVVPKIRACGDAAERMGILRDAGYDLGRSILMPGMLGDDPVGKVMERYGVSDRVALNALYEKCQRIMEG